MRADRQSMILGAICLALLPAAGCGTSAYMDRLTKGLEVVQTAAMFQVLAPAPVEIPGTPFTYKLPTYVDGSAKAYNEQSAEPNGQGPVKPERLQPPFLKLPGLKMCYEMMGRSADNTFESPYYLYVAAVPAGEMASDGKSIEDSIQAQLAAAFKSQPQWQETNCPVQNGPMVPWRRIIVTGEQPFLDTNGTAKPLPAIFELFTREVGDWRLMLAWRYPDKFQQRPGESAPLVCGSVISTAPAAPAPGAPAD